MNEIEYAKKFLKDNRRDSHVKTLEAVTIVGLLLDEIERLDRECDNLRERLDAGGRRCENVIKQAAQRCIEIVEELVAEPTGADNDGVLPNRLDSWYHGVCDTQEQIAYAIREDFGIDGI